MANVSHFTVAAAAALVGLFTHRATLKLREVFDAIFPPREGGQHADSLGGDERSSPDHSSRIPRRCAGGGGGWMT